MLSIPGGDAGVAAYLNPHYDQWSVVQLIADSKALAHRDFAIPLTSPSATGLSDTPAQLYSRLHAIPEKVGRFLLLGMARPFQHAPRELSALGTVVVCYYMNLSCYLWR